MIITIGGLAGTGTSTTAKTLSQEINIPFISAEMFLDRWLLKIT